MASSSRLDGRAAIELRPLSASFGELDRADGSARFSFGTESALASLSGPLEVRLREELPDKATFEVVHRPLEGVGATPSRALVTTLSASLPPLLGLGQHPRSLVQLIVQSLSPSPSSANSQSYPSTSTSSASSSQRTWPAPPITAEDDDDDRPERDDRHAPMTGIHFSARAAALNASTLAILDAGSISLRAVPIAVAVAHVPYRPARTGLANGNTNHRDDTGTLVLDPTSEEEERASSRHVFAWAFGVGIRTVSRDGEANGERGDTEVDAQAEDRGVAELVLVESEGEFTRHEFDEAMEQSKLAAGRVLEFVRQRMGEHFSRR